MSIEENKARIRRAYEEGLNQKNLAVFDELGVPDFGLHNGSMTIQGREAYKQFVSMYFGAIPDLHFLVEDLIAE
jgi:predicted ester cyclase